MDTRIVMGHHGMILNHLFQTWKVIQFWKILKNLAAIYQNEIFAVSKAVIYQIIPQFK